MTPIQKIITSIYILILIVSFKNKETEKVVAFKGTKTDFYTEPYRTQFHFTPEEKWMNDPNGIVYHKGVYQLFYQYYSEDIVW